MEPFWMLPCVTVMTTAFLITTLWEAGVCESAAAPISRTASATSRRENFCNTLMRSTSKKQFGRRIGIVEVSVEQGQCGITGFCFAPCPPGPLWLRFFSAVPLATPVASCDDLNVKTLAAFSVLFFSLAPLAADCAKNQPKTEAALINQETT